MAMMEMANIILAAFGIAGLRYSGSAFALWVGVLFAHGRQEMFVVWLALVLRRRKWIQKQLMAITTCRRSRVAVAVNDTGSENQETTNSNNTPMEHQRLWG
ncbi:hypothetical protein BX667DRAFT_532951 [Coemansia mojavensis]|nr:hypothetical protein BX667DRAFT_532951 [Coemansia mojavensis]